MRLTEVSVLLQILKIVYSSRGDRNGFSNCSSTEVKINGEATPPTSENEYFLRNTGISVQEGYNKMLDEIEKYLQQNMEYQACIETEDLESFMGKYCKVTEEGLRRVLIITSVMTSLSFLLSIIAIAVSVDARRKLARMTKMKSPAFTDLETISNRVASAESDYSAIEGVNMENPQFAPFNK